MTLLAVVQRSDSPVQASILGGSTGSALPRIAKWVAELGDDAGSAALLLRVLIDLRSLPVGLEALKRAELGKVINAIGKKHGDPEVVAESKRLVDHWRQVLVMHTTSGSATAAGGEKRARESPPSADEANKRARTSAEGAEQAPASTAAAGSPQGSEAARKGLKLTFTGRPPSAAALPPLERVAPPAGAVPIQGAGLPAPSDDAHSPKDTSELPPAEAPVPPPAKPKRQRVAGVRVSFADDQGRVEEFVKVRRGLPRPPSEDWARWQSTKRSEREGCQLSDGQPRRCAHPGATQNPPSFFFSPF